MLSNNTQDFFIGATTGHKIGLGLYRDAGTCESFDNAVAGKVFVNEEDEAARCSISQRRASSMSVTARS